MLTPIIVCCQVIIHLYRRVTEIVQAWKGQQDHSNSGYPHSEFGILSAAHLRNANAYCIPHKGLQCPLHRLINGLSFLSCFPYRKRSSNNVDKKYQLVAWICSWIYVLGWTHDSVWKIEINTHGVRSSKLASVTNCLEVDKWSSQS